MDREKLYFTRREDARFLQWLHNKNIMTTLLLKDDDFYGSDEP